MSRSTQKIASGLPGLDSVLQNVRTGESVVWQLSQIDDYAFFARPLAEAGLAAHKKVVYFQYANCPPLLAEAPGLTVIPLDPDWGFERFTVQVSKIIEQQGPNAYYIFDCVSELQSVWAADFMMRNFFMAVCPLIRQAGAVAYFSMLRYKHSYSATGQVREAVDILLNSITGSAGVYIHPLKVGRRHSPTMFLPHLFPESQTDRLLPLTDGISTSQYYALLGPKGTAGRRNLDNWDLFFMRANSAAAVNSTKSRADIEDKLYRILIGRDAERAALFRKYFKIRDYLDVNDRLVGSGSIGGKAAGMLLARKVIETERPDLAARMEPHDSFYIGANVFYTYLISNNWWKLWLEHKTPESYFMSAKALQNQLGYGRFPEMVRDMFRILLDHFGQNPIIVRSSSFLEDGFGNAFAGKYDSVFCVNAGSAEERYEDFVRAVKAVYASALDESALVYRKKRGLDQSEEQMSILVQRVSGSLFDDIYMPGAAGVGYSHNSYAWHKDIDPSAGMVRIVAGLGTRAVDRTSSDYPRIASLAKPSLMPRGQNRAAQHFVDLLDLRDNTLATLPLEEVAEKTPAWYRRLVVEHDREAENQYRERGIQRDVVYTTCENILKNKELTTCLRDMLATVEAAYSYPVDVEFTVNFSESGDFLIDLVQCRPLQAKGTGAHAVKLPQIPDDRLFFKLTGGAMGGPIDLPVDLIAIVDGQAYFDLPYNSKYTVPRAIDLINRYAGDNGRNLILLGPGRWGTTSPELGVPIRFAEISQIRALIEMSFESGHLMPELSFGSHFFQDLVEADIFYGAIYERNTTEGVRSLYRAEALADLPDLYPNLPGSIASLASVVKLYDASGRGLSLMSDSASERTLCFFNPKTASPASSTD